MKELYRLLCFALMIIVCSCSAGKVVPESQEDTPATKPEDIFTRTKISQGHVTNGVKLKYSGTQFTRIYSVLPIPVSNNYQDIASLEASGCTRASCPDGVNSYFWKDVQSSSIPASGEFVISESFDATVYKVTVDFSKIKDIQPYDKTSQECVKYLERDDAGLIDPTNAKIASTANTLWDEAHGDIIEYARKCFVWTHSNMKYGNMNTGLHPISELMTTMTGDCGNYTSVFVSLLRAKGIPARHVVMVHGKLDEFHVRAEFFIPGYGWIPADPTWGGDNFGVFDGDYIVMAKGIGTIVRGPDGNDFQTALLQTFCYWYWFSSEGTSISFTHSCTGLK